MLHYIATAREQYTIRRHLRHYGREVAEFVRPSSYAQLFRARTLPRGAYVFADIERLTPTDVERASHVRSALIEGGCLILNDPVWSMRRFELLRTMHDLGVNETNVYHATECRRPARFPVFVRGENDHGGSRSKLLNSEQELDLAIAELASQGVAREQLLITEFCDTKDADGVYRKFSAFTAQGWIIPRHEFFGRKWMLKCPELYDVRYLDEEFAYHETNPHEEPLRRIFSAARIDYGRIDYGIENGQVRVWEINTNPMISTPHDATIACRVRVQERFASAFNRALRVIFEAAPASGHVTISKRAIIRTRPTLWRRIAAALTRRAA